GANEIRRRGEIFGTERHLPRLEIQTLIIATEFRFDDLRVLIHDDGIDPAIHVAIRPRLAKRKDAEPGQSGRSRECRSVLALGGSWRIVIDLPHVSCDHARY